MLDFFIEPLFEFGEEEVALLLPETVRAHLDDGIDDDGSEFFDQVEGQGWPSIKGTVQVAHKVVETDQLDRAGNFGGQQSISKAEERVDGIGWWAFDSSRERPLPEIREQLPKATEVGRAARAFHAQNGFQGGAC